MVRRAVAMRRLLRFALLFALAGCGGGTVSSTPPIAPTPAATVAPLLAAIGDSITYGATVDNPATQAYPVLVGAALGIPVINLGIPGENTVNVVADEVSTMPSGATLVLLNLGTNDVMPTPAGRAAWEASYQGVLTAIARKAPLAKIVVYTFRNFAYGTPDSATVGAWVDAMDAWIAALPYTVVDLHCAAALYPGPGPNMYDDRHPNVAGNVVIAQLTLQALSSPAKPPAQACYDT